jgi:hypothetical protein
MNRTFAVVIVAALALCLSSIERITAAPPAAPPAAPCTKCTEKSCCKDKAKAGATAVIKAIKTVSAQTVAAAEGDCCDSECRDAKCCSKDKAKPGATVAAAIKTVSAQTVVSEAGACGQGECCGDECADGKCCSDKAKTAAPVAGIKTVSAQTVAAEAGACAEGQCCGDECADAKCCKGKCDAAAHEQTVDIDVTLPIPPLAAPTISFTATKSACPSSTCEHSACAGACPTATKATCAETKTFHYSAIPAPVASPFAKAPIGLPAPPVLPGAPHAWTIPLPQQPPHPILQASADVILPNPVPTRTTYAIAPVAPVAPASKITQVLFNIQVIEDRTGCLAEYEAFQNGDCIMFAESSTLLPALRIMQKHNLVGSLAAPKLVCMTGDHAHLQVGNEIATGDKPRWQGVKVEVGAEEYETGLKVELAVHASHEEHTCQVHTAVHLEEGQTIVLRSQTTAAGDEEDCCCKSATYVVLTPELVK